MQIPKKLLTSRLPRSWEHRSRFIAWQLLLIIFFLISLLLLSLFLLGLPLLPQVRLSFHFAYFIFHGNFIGCYNCTFLLVDWLLATGIYYSSWFTWLYTVCSSHPLIGHKTPKVHNPTFWHQLFSSWLQKMLNSHLYFLIYTLEPKYNGRNHYFSQQKLLQSRIKCFEFFYFIFSYHKLCSTAIEGV